MNSQVSRTSVSIWVAIAQLLRWHQPAGRLILLIPALWSLTLASEGLPSLKLLLIITVGAIATSAAGCIVNDCWDRNIDPHVQRTQNRPLASRRLSLGVALGLMVIALLCAWGLTFYLTPLGYWLAVAAVPVILLYPLAKRVLPIPQLVLAVAWGFAVLIPWAAVQGRLTLTTAWLWAAVVMWTLAFDTVYAMPDRPDDRRLGVNSSALFFGAHAPLAIALFYALTVIFLMIVGLRAGLPWRFWLALAVTTYFWLRQSLQIYTHERRDTQTTTLPIQTYGRYFNENVWLGFLLWVGMWCPRP
ncbi:4-hydroxybenzoate solanesyltransferase PlqA [Thermosynechococcus sp. NK55a]|nr:4-hydroxybenzoate solanesyltransferase PlqA [Thermosynechococcus sp. NK55a]RMH66023.1 MAG: 4-hydroxybenzoate octaprenyltransferase [Cyanobacteria bacterium J003]